MTMAKRKLTDDERRAIRDTTRQQEIAKHPHAFITVLVDAETDENGEPIVRVHRLEQQDASVAPKPR